jgi:hypothetical protein
MTQPEQAPLFLRVHTRVVEKKKKRKKREPSPATTVLAAKAARTKFKTALDLARTFPFGSLASQVCPYCYNTGYSSPGTRCSYCRRGER